MAAIDTQSTIRPRIMDPSTPQNFTKPFTVRWDKGTTNVKEFWLCVGTMEGDWDIFSGYVGMNLQHALDLSGRPAASEVHILLICTEEDPESREQRTYDAHQVMVKRA